MRRAGGRFAGWSSWPKDGKPAYTYNILGPEWYTVASSEPLPAGQSKLAFDFAYGGVGKGGMGILSVNGREFAEGRSEHNQSRIFSADETADAGIAGIDEATPVVDGIGEGPDTRFNVRSTR